LQFLSQSLRLGGLYCQWIPFGSALQIAINEVRKQGSEEVRKGHLSVLVVVKTAAKSFDVSIWYHIPRTMSNQQPFDLRFVYLPFIFAIHGLEKFSYLQISFAELHASKSSVKPLNLPLNLSFDLYLALHELRQRTHNIITLLLDFMQLFAFDLSQQLG